MADEKKVDEAALLAADPTLEHHILKPSEVLAARATALKKMEAERRKNAMAAVEKEEAKRLQEEEGQVTGAGVLDEMVDITLDLAPFVDRIVVNLRPFFHGQTYRVPRHVAMSLRETMQRGWRHQDEIDGKSLTAHYQRPRLTEISPVRGIKNAPTYGAAA